MPQQKPLTENTTQLRKKQRPLIVATRKPQEIVDGTMAYDDQAAMIKHLRAHQKTRGSWEEYRAKIPDALLEKWQIVLEVCRRQGFFNPYVVGEEIRWMQIVGRDRHCDPCTVCPKTYQDGSCFGSVGEKNNHMEFTPCWRGGK